MSFMMKKKKYKFQVDFTLEELSSVPFVNCVLFAKVRLLDGGSFTEVSTREEVLEHCVKWGKQFNYTCKMSANVTTGILDPCICRVSVRKELKGGRSFQKLGFADLNLAEFAGAGVTTRRYLLEGYDTKHRQDNSILKVTVGMTLQSGDPCFKAPSFRQPMLLGEQPDDHLQGERKTDDFSGGSLASSSSGFGSLPRKQRPTVLNTDLGNPDSLEAKREELIAQDFELGHSRNSSSTSQHSKVSGYSSLHSHSRQGSSESGHIRNPSSGSAYSDAGLTVTSKGTKRPNKQKQLAEENRMDSTRVNPDDVIKDLMEGTNLASDESSENSGLQLIVNRDGTTALGSQDSKVRLSDGTYERIIMEKSAERFY